MENAGDQQQDLKIARYSLVDLEDDYGSALAEHKEGEYVKYDDYMRHMLNPHGLRLTKDDNAFFSLIQGLLDITGDCEAGSETFCGWQLQQAADKDTSETLFIRLVALDRIGDVVTPRAIES